VASFLVGNSDHVTKFSVVEMSDSDLSGKGIYSSVSSCSFLAAGMSINQDLLESSILTMTGFPSVLAHKLSQGGHLPH
jgi:hypothetical protein